MRPFLLTFFCQVLLWQLILHLSTRALIALLLQPYTYEAHYEDANQIGILRHLLLRATVPHVIEERAFLFLIPFFFQFDHKKWYLLSALYKMSSGYTVLCAMLLALGRLVFPLVSLHHFARWERNVQCWQQANKSRRQRQLYTAFLSASSSSLSIVVDIIRLDALSIMDWPRLQKRDVYLWDVPNERYIIFNNRKTRCSPFCVAPSLFRLRWLLRMILFSSYCYYSACWEWCDALTCVVLLLLLL